MTKIKDYFYIYKIKDIENHYKFGITGNLKNRKSNLGTGIPFISNFIYKTYCQQAEKLEDFTRYIIIH